LHLVALRLGIGAALRVFGGRGLHDVVRALARVFGRKHVAVFRVFGSRQIEIGLHDRYWIPYILGFRDYEPEVAAGLARVLDETAVFIDGGANIGWWSVYASTRIPDPSRILAIEAAPAVYARLERNAALNDGAFTCRNSAVWSRSGEQLTIRVHASKHGSSSVTREYAGRRGYEPHDVCSTTVRDAIAECGAGPDDIVVLKLDVEGAEIPALAGMGDRRPSLLVYEDHGMERESATSAQVFSLGYRVFAWDGGRFRELFDLAEVRALKTNPACGYNFFATDDDEVAKRLFGQEAGDGPRPGLKPSRLPDPPGRQPGGAGAPPSPPSSGPPPSGERARPDSGPSRLGTATPPSGT